MVGTFGGRTFAGACLLLHVVFLSAIPGCGRQSRNEEDSLPDIRYGDLRMKALEYVMHKPVERGQAVLLEQLENASFDTVLLEDQAECIVNGWFVDMRQKTMKKVLYANGPETYSLSVVFQDVQPTPIVKDVRVTVYIK